MEELHELRAASEALKRLDQRRADQAAYRASVLRRAHAAGATWRELQDASGLSPRGVQLTLRDGPK